MTPAEVDEFLEDVSSELMAAHDRLHGEAVRDKRKPPEKRMAELLKLSQQANDLRRMTWTLGDAWQRDPPSISHINEAIRNWPMQIILNELRARGVTCVMLDPEPTDHVEVIDDEAE